jgi:hypothetical protein
MILLNGLLIDETAKVFTVGVNKFIYSDSGEKEINAICGFTQNAIGTEYILNICKFELYSKTKVNGQYTYRKKLK